MRSGSCTISGQFEEFLESQISRWIFWNDLWLTVRESVSQLVTENEAMDMELELYTVQPVLSLELGDRVTFGAMEV